jgi:hypothetical protein
MYYTVEDHAFSPSDDLAPFPTLLLPRTSSCLSFSATRLCSLLTGEWGGGEQTIRLRESLVLYNTHNTLWPDSTFTVK